MTVQAGVSGRKDAKRAADAAVSADQEPAQKKQKKSVRMSLAAAEAPAEPSAAGSPADLLLEQVEPQRYDQGRLKLCHP